MKTSGHWGMHTQFHRGSGLILLRIDWGVLGIGATIPLVRLGAGIARTEERIERGADQDYFQKQIGKVLNGQVARRMSARLANTEEVRGRQMGLL